MWMRGVGVAGIVLLSLAVAVSATRAGEGDRQVRFGLAWISPTDESTQADETQELDDAVGFQASFEQRFAEGIGVEPGISITSHDVELEEPGQPDVDLGEVDLLALTVNVNFHVLKDGNVDLFVGPTIGYAFWGNIEGGDVLQDLPTDDEFVYGANLGVDVPLGDGGWAFSGGVSVLFTEVPVEGTSAIGVDPIRVRAGASYSF